MVVTARQRRPYSSVALVQTRAIRASRTNPRRFRILISAGFTKTRKKYLEAARHYGKVLEQQPGFTEAARDCTACRRC